MKSVNRVGFQAGAECLDGTRGIATLTENDSIVEVSEMDSGTIVVECDPCLVEFRSSGVLTCAIESLGQAQQIQKTQPLVPREIKCIGSIVV